MRSRTKEFHAGTLHGVATVTDILDCSRQQVRDLIRQGKLKAIKTSEDVNLVTHEEAVRFKEHTAATA